MAELVPLPQRRLVIDAVGRPVRPLVPAVDERMDLSTWTTDITCTRPGCDRAVLGVSLLEVAWSRPCPLCAICRDCRSLCATGQVEHGIAPQLASVAGPRELERAVVFPAIGDGQSNVGTSPTGG